MIMLYIRAGEPAILSRGIDKNQLRLIFEAFLNDARGRPTLPSSRRTKDGAMPTEESFRLYGYRALLSNIYGPQIEKDRIVVFAVFLHQPWQQSNKLVRGRIDPITQAGICIDSCCHD